MREIIFRGKDKDSNWIYGYFNRFTNYKYDIYPAIIPILNDKSGSMSDLVGITEETVGQYTGLKDKNGKKIFEGDIIEVTCKFKGKVQYENCGIVKYNQSNCSFQLEIFTDDSIDFPLFESVDYGDNDKQDTFIIIGNIWDNPEIIKENE